MTAFAATMPRWTAPAIRMRLTRVSAGALTAPILPPGRGRARGAAPLPVDRGTHRVGDPGAEQPVFRRRDLREGDHFLPDTRGRRVDLDGGRHAARRRLPPAEMIRPHQDRHAEDREQEKGVRAALSPALLLDRISDHAPEQGEDPSEWRRHQKADGSFDVEADERDAQKNGRQDRQEEGVPESSWVSEAMQKRRDEPHAERRLTEQTPGVEPHEAHADEAGEQTENDPDGDR